MHTLQFTFFPSAGSMQSPLPETRLRSRILLLATLLLLLTPVAHAVIFGRVQGVVHDPHHRPVSGAQVQLHAANSAFEVTALTGRDGAFLITSVPLGDYTLSVIEPGFAPASQTLTLASDTSPVLHFELQVGTVEQIVSGQHLR